MSTVYRFHDRVAINPPSGPTYYLTLAQARIMEQALYDVARDIDLRKFTSSTVGTVTLPDAWTFTANSRGYMLFYNGKPQGGAGILDSAKGPTGKNAAKQVASYSAYCKAECDKRNRERREGKV